MNLNTQDPRIAQFSKLLECPAFPVAGKLMLCFITMPILLILLGLAITLSLPAMLLGWVVLGYVGVLERACAATLRAVEKDA